MSVWPSNMGQAYGLSFNALAAHQLGIRGEHTPSPEKKIMVRDTEKRRAKGQASDECLEVLEEKAFGKKL